MSSYFQLERIRRINDVVSRKPESLSIIRHDFQEKLRKKGKSEKNVPDNRISFILYEHLARYTIIFAIFVVKEF